MKKQVKELRERVKLTPDELRRKFNGYLGEVIVYHRDLIEDLVLDVAQTQLNKVLNDHSLALIISSGHPGNAPEIIPLAEAIKEKQ